MSKELIKEFILMNEFTIKNVNISCREIVGLKDNFYNIYGKKPRISEAIIFTWLQSNLRELFNNNMQYDYTLKPETKYPAQYGNQTLDISVLDKNEIKLGISIKMSSSTSAYLDGADFSNPFFERYRQYFIKNEIDYNRKLDERKRIGVPTLLQDMARIQNLKLIRTPFPSITIVYSTSRPKDSFWIKEFEKLEHHYIFLEEHLDIPFIKILREKLLT